MILINRRGGTIPPYGGGLKGGGGLSPEGGGMVCIKVRWIYILIDSLSSKVRWIYILKLPAQRTFVEQEGTRFK